MRPSQHNNNNNKRGRSRSRHHSGSSGGSGMGGGNGGNPLSRVYESNGPDVKVRGTAQTIAEKYLQLARDAQSSSDIVMGESFYQHAEHYLRIVSAAQAYAQQNQPQQYRRPDDEEDDEGDGEDGGSQGNEQPGLSRAEQPDSGNEPEFDSSERAAQPQPQPYRQQRDFRERDQRPNDRDPRPNTVPPPPQQQANRDRFRPRWQDRRDKPPVNEAQDSGFQPRETFVQPVPEEQPRIIPAPAPANGNAAEEADQWEAPSFLRRPAAMPVADAVIATDEPAPERKRPGRKPRNAPALETAEPAVLDPDGD